MSLSAAKRSLLPQGDVIGKAAALRPCDSDVCPEYAGTVQKPDVAASEQSRTGIRVCGGNQRNAPVCGAKHGIRIARPADLVTDRDLRRHAADRNLQPDVPRVTGENIQVQLRSGERGCQFAAGIHRNGAPPLCRLPRDGAEQGRLSDPGGA